MMMKIKEIWADHREDLPNSKHEFVIKTLDTADYVVCMEDGRQVFIERKQVQTADIFHSIFDGRLLSQAERMGKLDYSVIWVDGEVIQNRDGSVGVMGPFGGRVIGVDCNYNLLMSRLADCQLLGNIVYIHNDFDTMIRLLVNKMLSKEIRIPMVKTKHDDLRVAMMMVLPGYGEKRAKKALDDNVWLYDELGKIIAGYTS